MGQKVNPIGFRLGIIKTWQSKWYDEKNYAKFLHEDLKIRKYNKIISPTRVIGKERYSRNKWECRSFNADRLWKDNCCRNSNDKDIGEGEEGCLYSSIEVPGI